MRIAILDICAIFVPLIHLKNVLCFGPYMGNYIVFFIFFLSWIYLPCMRSVEHVFVEKRVLIMKAC